MKTTLEKNIGRKEKGQKERRKEVGKKEGRREEKKKEEGRPGLAQGFRGYSLSK